MTLTRKFAQRGIGLIDVVVVMTIILIVGAFSVPQFLRALENNQLRASAAEVADLIQRARIGAARTNAIYPIRYATSQNLQQVYIDTNNNGSWDSTEPTITLPQHMVGASGAPDGTGGTPTAYTLVGDTSSGTPYDNANVLAFSPRGLPCNYPSATCSTPATTYFVYYFKDNRNNGGWSAVLVTKSGRSKVLMWNGGGWK